MRKPLAVSLAKSSRDRPDARIDFVARRGLGRGSMTSPGSVTCFRASVCTGLLQWVVPGRAAVGPVAALDTACVRVSEAALASFDTPRLEVVVLPCPAAGLSLFDTPVLPLPRWLLLL